MSLESRRSARSGRSEMHRLCTQSARAVKMVDFTANQHNYPCLSITLELGTQYTVMARLESTVQGIFLVYNQVTP